MRLLETGMMLTVMLVCAAPSHAQILFPRKAKVNPNQRVPELIVIVKTSPDERKRAHAAEELRDYDPAVFSEIVPVLVDVLQNDKKHTVRMEALSSLAKIRPVTPLAGRAIEKAAADDDSVRVRLQARALLPKYHLAGYLSKNSSPANNPATTTSDRKPLPVGPTRQTQEPPLAEPRPLTIPTPPPATKQPAPAPIPMPAPAPVGPQVETPTDRPIPRPFPIPVPAPKSPAPAEGPSLFP